MVCEGRPLVNGLVLMFMWPLRDFTFFQTQKAFKHNSNKNNVRYRVESKLSAAQDSVDCRLYSVESRLSPVRDSVESQSGVLSGRTLSHKECAESQHFECMSPFFPVFQHKFITGSAQSLKIFNFLCEFANEFKFFLFVS